MDYITCIFLFASMFLFLKLSKERTNIKKHKDKIQTIALEHLYELKIGGKANELNSYHGHFDSVLDVFKTDAKVILGDILTANRCLMIDKKPIIWVYQYQKIGESNYWVRTQSIVSYYDDLNDEL